MSKKKKKNIRKCTGKDTCFSFLFSFLVHSKHFVSCLTQHFKYTVRGMIASQRKAPSPYPYFGFEICMHLHDFIMHMPFVPWVGTIEKKKKKKKMEPCKSTSDKKYSFTFGRHEDFDES